jgi:hypothetical protein
MLGCYLRGEGSEKLRVCTIARRLKGKALHLLLARGSSICETIDLP